MIFPKYERFETGLKLPNKSPQLGCLWRGCKRASLSSSEKIPASKLLFAILVMMHARNSICTFSKDVGIGSNSHDIAGAEQTISFTSLWRTGVNLFILWSVSNLASMYLLSRPKAFSQFYYNIVSFSLKKKSLKPSANLEIGLIGGKRDSCFLNNSPPLAILKMVL